MKRLFLIFLLAFQLSNSQVGVDAYTPFGVTTPINEYVTSNAANAENEANATTGFTLSGGTGSATIASTNTGATPTNGSYFLTSTHTGAANTSAFVRETITSMLIPGHTYRLTFDANRIARPSGSGNTTISVQDSSFAVLATTGNMATSPGWNPFILEFTYTSGAVYITVGHGTTTDPGDIIGWDNIVIIDLTS